MTDYVYSWRLIARASVALKLVSRVHPWWLISAVRTSRAAPGSGSVLGTQLQRQHTSRSVLGSGGARVGQSSTIGEHSYVWCASRGSPITRFDWYSIFF